MSINEHMFKRLAKIAALALALATGTTAQAQFGEAAGIAEAMQQDYLRRDIVLFQQGLNLDDTQRSVIDTLYGDYETKFEEGLAQMRKRIEDMREELQSQDVDRVLRIVFRPIEDWSKDKRALGDHFLEDVKIILTPDQLEQWPKFERFLFREKNLSKGTLSGESLNLFYVVRDMKLTEPETQAIQPTMDEYDVALDQALRNRQRALTGDQSEMLKSFSEQNATVSLAILQRQIDMKIAVRGVNDRFIDQVAAAMPEARKEEFRQNALERAYPRVYRTSPGQNIFNVAKGLEDLDAGVRNSVIEMETAFIAELDVINAELAALVRTWEPTEERLRAEAFAQRMAGQQPAEIEDQSREPFLKRDEIIRRYVRQLRSVLTETQFAQLPGGYRWADLPAMPKPPTGAGNESVGDAKARDVRTPKTPDNSVKPDGDGGGGG